jgi:hypothetical protein
MGLCSVLFVVLLVLKLCGVIFCSWWIVVLPLLAIPLVFLLTLVVYGCVVLLSAVVRDL